jgi:hypothetical protein
MSPSDPSTPRVARRVAINPIDLDLVLVRLRRDTPEQRLEWNLGENGAFDLDTSFVALGPSDGPGFATSARLWDPTHLAVAPIVVTIRPGGDGRCELEARAGSLSPWWSRHVHEFLRLATAALDELGEELLWYAAGLRRERRPF